MIDQITMNARKPGENEYGNAMLERMNQHHKELHRWALDHISLDSAQTILDVGFGGGQNICNLLHLAQDAKIWGIDYSPASYKKCAELNHDAIASGRLELQIGSADALPYADDSFDLVTAFETVYYWPQIETCFANVYHALRANGCFLICNEDSSLEGNETLAQALDMAYYSCDDLDALLRKAGFATVHTFTHPNGKWICAVGIK